MRSSHHSRCRTRSCRRACSKVRRRSPRPSSTGSPSSLTATSSRRQLVKRSILLLHAIVYHRKHSCRGNSIDAISGGVAPGSTQHFTENVD
eukprot:scaffold1088_cov58-Phaeocystis_antarctica.AAC.4